MKTTRKTIIIIFFLSLFLASNVKAQSDKEIPQSNNLERASNPSSEYIEWNKIKTWLERASNQGHMEAQFVLGRILLLFSERNMEQVKTWVNRQGSPSSKKQYFPFKISFRSYRGFQGVL